MMVFHVVSACRQALVKPQHGHRCVTHTEVYADITNISWQLCTWYCLKDAYCGVISYDADIRLCRRSAEKCMYFHRDTGYAALAMNMTDTCLRWVSLNNVDLNDAFSSQSIFTVSRIFVVRGISNDDMVPGKYLSKYVAAYHIVDGVEVPLNDPEFLVVRDGCTVDWVTYDSGTGSLSSSSCWWLASGQPSLCCPICFSVWAEHWVLWQSFWYGPHGLGR